MKPSDPNFIFLGAIASCSSNRLAALVELEKRMETCRRTEAELKQRLVATAPKLLQKLLIEDLIIQHLFEYGLAERKYGWGNEQDHFKNARQMREAFQALEKAWGQNVSVDLDESGVDPIQVRIKAISL